MNHKMYHLSHTDLDGYACQMVTAMYFKNISFYNSNYGKEINECFDSILKEIQISNDMQHIILITDVNLTMEQAKEFNSKVNLCEKDVLLLLLDHHKSGQECSDEYEWYFMDPTRSATKITYDFFASIFEPNEEMEHFVNIVNSVDIWLEDKQEFELGKVLLGLVSGAREVNRIMFPQENTDYIFSLLNQSQKFFKKENPHIVLDDHVHKLKKYFFKHKNNTDDTLSNLVSNYIVKLLTKNKDKMQIIYKEYKGILTYNIGSVSVIGNDFLNANPDIDFFMDVTSKKTISLRSNGKVDVSKMAAHIANGGGHPNASGGLLNTFKDSFIYDDIKSQIVNIISSKG
ncbi:MAG: 3'-to-5' oligoribonuclease B [Sulfurospirillaceae bacterium]|nr:3'-to-5' oligoribonuclease B [Sulfurospirillaceae bacterium]MDD3462933.1 3'-to-5' oligoribonuclease B [Sulfurospirillaceae bacterium]